MGSRVARSPLWPALAALLLPIAAHGAESRTDYSPVFRTDAVEKDLRATPASTGGARGACAAALCYDASDRRIVFTPARQYMPKFDGLTPETVSLRRNAIVFRYSFR